MHAESSKTYSKHLQMTVTQSIKSNTIYCMKLQFYRPAGWDIKKFLVYLGKGTWTQVPPPKADPEILLPPSTPRNLLIPYCPAGGTSQGVGLRATPMGIPLASALHTLLGWDAGPGKIVVKYNLLYETTMLPAGRVGY